jgi:hypothetical protein
VCPGVPKITPGKLALSGRINEFLLIDRARALIYLTARAVSTLFVSIRRSNEYLPTCV